MCLSDSLLMVKDVAFIFECGDKSSIYKAYLPVQYQAV